MVSIYFERRGQGVSHHHYFSGEESLEPLS